MPLGTATISLDLSDILGADFDARRTKVWVTTNVPSETIVDTDGNKIRLGSGNVTVNADGTGTFTTWVPGAGSNPASWQTYLHVDYPDRNAPRGRGQRTFGPFTITASADLAVLIDEQEVPPVYPSAVGTALGAFVSSAEAAASTASASATSAAASAAAAQTIVLGTIEEQVGPLIAASAPRQRVSRVLEKLVRGQNIKATFMGDSITEAHTVTTEGVDGFPDLLCTTLATRFGVTVTKNNRGVSGRTVATFMSYGDFDTSMADKADLYVIAFGKNDNSSDKGTMPGIGYPRAASTAGLEHMIRRIRLEVPGADIILLTENPNTVGNSANPYMEAYNTDVRALADYYGTEFVDGYAAFQALGNWNTYLLDGIHPNSAGHAKLADALLAKFPQGAKPAPVVTPVPSSSRYGTHRYDRRNWERITTSVRTANTAGFDITGTWTGTGPVVSSTAASTIIAQFIGTEVLLRLDAGAGNGVVHIDIDGQAAYTNLDLSTFGTGQRFFPLTGLAMGPHNIVITVVSGTVTFRGFDYLAAPAVWRDADNPLITFTGTWTRTVANATEYYGKVAKFSTTSGDSLSFSFIGTGFGVFLNRFASAHAFGVVIDGVTMANVSTTFTTFNTSIKGAVLFYSGLAYGRHTVTVTAVTTRQSTIGGVFSFDETRDQRPTVQRALGVVGDAVTFPAPYQSPPAVRVTPDDATSALPPYAATPTSTGTTLAGTASARVLWETDGSRVAF